MNCSTVQFKFMEMLMAENDFTMWDYFLMSRTVALPDCSTLWESMHIEKSIGKIYNIPFLLWNRTLVNFMSILFLYILQFIHHTQHIWDVLIFFLVKNIECSKWKEQRSNWPRICLDTQILSFCLSDTFPSNNTACHLGMW